MTDLVEIQIPFDGFYNTIHDSAIDDALENCFNWNHEKQEEVEITDATRDAIFMADVDWNAIRLEYCERYVDAFGDRFGLTLTLEEVTSPREYNFATDRIFAKIPREQINKIRKEVEEHKDWPQYIKDNFTDCSGFWSFYDNDCKHEDWTREDLDECQYGVIIKFWLDNIFPDMGIEGWHMEQYYLTEDFEMCNWESIEAARLVIEEYITDSKSYAHCAGCDKVIDMDNDVWEVIKDETYCTECAKKEA